MNEKALSDEMPRFHRSSFCSKGGCVEVAELPDGDVVLRDSKCPEWPVLRFDRAEWAAFVAGVRAGEFDR